jgi:hypothetical protein
VGSGPQHGGLRSAAAAAAGAFRGCPPPLRPPPPARSLTPLPQVISNRMQKSVLVAVDRLVKHKKYDRILKRTTKLMVRQDVTAV